MSYLNLYDTTLRDGAQNPFVSFTTEGKLKATRILDGLGVDYIEGGFPQAGGQEEYFSAVRGLRPRARISAFGMTPRSPDFEKDPSLKPLVEAGTGVVTLVAKTPEVQIERVLRMKPAEYTELTGRAVSYLKSLGKEVVMDAEHFFDAYKQDRKSAMELLEACGEADWLVLCDTNGGAFYRDVAGVVENTVNEMGNKIGVHFHNDRGLGVANTLEAAYAGARHVQVTMNGMGERTGNTNLVDVAGNLLGGNFCMGLDSQKLTEAAREMERLSCWSIMPNAPFVGRLAFAHSGGMHSDAMLKYGKSYEHFSPVTFGNERAFPISGQAGRAAIVLKLRTWGYDFNKSHPIVMDLLEDLSGMGYVGDAQFYKTFRSRMGGYRDPIEIERIDVMDNIGFAGSRPEANVKLRANGTVFHEVAEGDGQVDAIDNALRKALGKIHPEIDEVKLLSYTVPPITGTGTDASVQVRTYFGNGSEKWDSFRAGTDLIAESASALVDAYRFFLLRQEDKNR